MNQIKLTPIYILLFLLNSCTNDFSNSGYETGNVQIARDAYGVPHIFGKTDADVAYGLAWAHAEDDFETTQLTLLAGKAMLGRYLGEQGAAVDFFVHLLETRDIASNKYLSDFSPDFQKLVDAYLSGINDFALTYPERVLLKEAFPVTHTDIISAYILSLAQMSGADGAVQKIVAGTIDKAEVTDPAAGSNAIAIHPSRTDSGEAFLAINSHQPLTGPVAWYEAHLHSEAGWNILGGLFPGGLTVFHGVNEHLGWAHTVNNPDKLDVFQLKMHPEKKNRYEVDGEWLELQEKRVWLKVKMWDLVTIPVPKKVWKSVFGPTLVTDQGVFSIRTGSLEVITAPEQWYRMNKAKNYSEFKAAMDMMALPGFNTVYADKYDTIYYVSNALLPVRNPEFDFSKTLLGDSRSKLWEEYYPFDALPQQVNPSSGYLFNTNHSAFKASAEADNLDFDTFPTGMGYYLTDNNRSLRFREVMQDTGLLSYEKFKSIKFDKQLPENLAYEINVDALFSLDPALYPDIAEELEILNTWNKQSTTRSRGAALFAFAYYAIRDKTKEENLDPKRVLNKEEAAETIKAAKDYFAHHFPGKEVHLGDFQKLVRGGKALPLFGIPDVIAAMRSEPYQGGVRKGEQGESYIILVKFGEGLPEIETVNVYGASNQTDSPHYTDQMELFVNQQLKPMTLEKEEVLENAVRVYNPGN
ncbi:penicillin acylase family protein [Cecembia sp.]|uniref:penicillin acylase family protein n=1 Tax=Cecembia sp. TaxID=1898110 RepID=UPI0025C1B25C|nr:penicillin acylase family protein [Cecembia sp.]